MALALFAYIYCRSSTWKRSLLSIVCSSRVRFCSIRVSIWLSRWRFSSSRLPFNWLSNLTSHGQYVHKCKNAYKTHTIMQLRKHKNVILHIRIRGYTTPPTTCCMPVPHTGLWALWRRCPAAEIPSWAWRSRPPARCAPAWLHSAGSWAACDPLSATRCR